MQFKNREEAARALAQKLMGHRGRDPLVLGIPRGGVPMARIIAEALNGDLDIVLVHKIGAPGNPEYAIGAVSEHGEITIRPEARAHGIPEEYIREEARQQVELLRQRRLIYTPAHSPISAEGRTVIIVDNGVATGATMIAALDVIREQKPAEMIAAMAVSPPETVRKIKAGADRVVVLYQPPSFHGVSQFFMEFDPVEDDEVIRILQQSRPSTALRKK